MIFKIKSLLVILFLYPFFAWGTEELKGYLLDQYEGATITNSNFVSFGTFIADDSTIMKI